MTRHAEAGAAGAQAAHRAGLQVDARLLGLPLGGLPGVGWALQKRLTELQLDSVSQLRSAGRARLQRELGDKVPPWPVRTSHPH